MTTTIDQLFQQVMEDARAVSSPDKIYEALAESFNTNVHQAKDDGADTTQTAFACLIHHQARLLHSLQTQAVCIDYLNTVLKTLTFTQPTKENIQ